MWAQHCHLNFLFTFPSCLKMALADFGADVWPPKHIGEGRFQEAWTGPHHLAQSGFVESSSMGVPSEQQFEQQEVLKGQLSVERQLQLQLPTAPTW